MTAIMLGKIFLWTFAAIGGLTVLVLLVGLPGLSTKSATPAVASASSASSASSANKAFDWYRYEVSVGASGTDFDGSCLVTGSDGSMESKTISGTGPQSYTYTGRGISCNYQKRRGNSAPLTVTVRRDGQVMKTVDTTTEYGIVSFVL